MEKIIHIMPDDKFIDDFIRRCEEDSPGRSLYLILLRAQRRFVSSEGEHIKFITFEAPWLLGAELTRALHHCKIIVLHCFDSSYWSFIKDIPKSVKIFWIVWGIEIYSAIPKSYYISQQSLSLQYGVDPLSRLRFCIRLILNYFVSKRGKIYRKIIRRADYCATFVIADIELAQRINPDISSVPFCYFNAVGYGLNDSVVGTKLTGNLLLGNSANPSNEHASALRRLSEMNYSGKIYCPLSYGGSTVYIENIIHLGGRLFGRNFIPLIDFMPYSEYSKLISDCDFICMNHVRQNAVGNILKAMCSMKPVILNKDSFLRSTFSSWGVKVYDYDIIKNPLHVRSADLLRNRKIVLSQLENENNQTFFDLLFHSHN